MAEDKNVSTAERPTYKDWMYARRSPGGHKVVMTLVTDEPDYMVVDTPLPEALVLMQGYIDKHSAQYGDLVLGKHDYDQDDPDSEKFDAVVLWGTRWETDAERDERLALEANSKEFQKYKELEKKFHPKRTR